METATLVAIFISGLLVSFTGYALNTAFDLLQVHWICGYQQRMC